MSTEHKGWIGVDFDGTLAHYTGWVDAKHCGAPIRPMVDRVKAWLAEGQEVRIFTARVFPVWYADPAAQRGAWPLLPGTATSPERVAECGDAIWAIQAWCAEHLGQVLPITCVKDFAMRELWDDRAVQVHPNLGTPIDTATHAPTLHQVLGDSEGQRALIGVLVEMLSSQGSVSLPIEEMNATRTAQGACALEVEVTPTHYHVRVIDVDGGAQGPTGYVGVLQ